MKECGKFLAFFCFVASVGLVILICADLAGDKEVHEFLRHVSGFKAGVFIAASSIACSLAKN